jgi:hypothetical protein
MAIGVITGVVSSLGIAVVTVLGRKMKDIDVILIIFYYGIVGFGFGSLGEAVYCWWTG